jgi:hypothetical protein
VSTTPTAARTHTEILPALAEAIDDRRTLGDLGYQGGGDTITVAFKTPSHGDLATIHSSSTGPTTAHEQTASGQPR